MTGLLKRASDGLLDEKTRRSIESICEEFKVCEKNGQPPRRFELTVGTDDIAFNHHVQFYTMLIGGKPILHMVDIATHFFPAGFFWNQSTPEVWKGFQRLFNLVYMGPPDHLTVDQVPNYLSKEFRGYL